ncbi:hypothetical protein P5673_017382 [Acropora cervicornis]|uniref:Uncharacterized protein n=1 Tax=Acropora cervicornis TaxID=6130 RepID=A0AAD9V3G7_ACRCE|nr:hypothetical protein P5673_017382 [Acropora cervicornis]
MFPARDRTFKSISDVTSTTVIERLRELKAFDIFQHPLPKVSLSLNIFPSQGNPCVRWFCKGFGEEEKEDIGIKDIEFKYKGVLLITMMCKESNNDIVHKKAKDDNGVGTVRFSFAIQNQSSARMVKEHLRSLSSNIGIDIQPVFRNEFGFPHQQHNVLRILSPGELSVSADRLNSQLSPSFTQQNFAEFSSESRVHTSVYERVNCVGEVEEERAEELYVSRHLANEIRKSP